MNSIEILEEFIEDYIHGDFVIQDRVMRAIENLIQENKELKEYKKIAELTKVSCCTAQNCEALNNAIKNGLENEKLLQENKELKKENLELHKEINQRIKLKLENERCADKDFIPKSKVKEKIEEMKRYRDYRPVINKFTYSEIIDYEIKILQELLEEGE